MFVSKIVTNVWFNNLKTYLKLKLREVMLIKDVEIELDFFHSTTLPLIIYKLCYLF